MRTSKQISLKPKTISLRKKGYSYNYITKQTGVSKSTLNGWLQNVAYTPNNYTKRVIGNARAASGLAKNKIRMGDIETARKEAAELVSKISKRDLLILGIGIYIGEGTKSHEQVRIINSDPRIIATSIRWFVNIFSVPMENLYIRLHLYPDNNAEKAILYWSRETGIPKKNFQKISVDRRMNKKMLNYGKLPYGTAHLSVQSKGDKRFGKHLARLIFGVIDIVLDPTRD